MDQEFFVELLLLLLAAVYLGARWIYRRARTLTSRRLSQAPPHNLRSPGSTFPPPPKRSLPPVAAPAAIGSFFGVLLGSLLFAIWVSSQASVPANVAGTAALVPAWFCIGTLLVSAFSAVAVTIADNAFSEFQARRLPKGVPFLVGALIGLAFTLIFAVISLSTPCGPLEPC